MVRHVVLFKWIDDLPDGHVSGVAAALDALPPAIPEIAGYSHGANLGLYPGTWDYAVVGDFASPEDHAVYRDHPQHLQFIADFITGFVAERASLQFALGDAAGG